MAEKRIVIVEGERDLTARVVARLKKENYAVKVVSRGPEGIQEIRSKPPDLVIIDVLPPHSESIQQVTEIRRDFSTAAMPIILLAARGEESDIMTGLAMGADDYITKPLSLPVLTARVAAMLRRSATTSVAKAPLVFGSLSIDTERHIVRVNGRAIGLTMTEFRLLTALTAARGRVLSRAQLIDQVLRENIVSTDRIIDVHVTSLRRKLGHARSLIRTVRGIGYGLDDAGSDAEHAE